MSSHSQSRHVYTREQRAILETSFARQSHPDIQEKERLAKLFNCNLIQISNWFQNHRRRVKKQLKSSAPTTPTPVSTSTYAHQHQPDCPYISSSTESVSYYYYYPASPCVYPTSYYPHPSYEPFTGYYGQ